MKKLTNKKSRGTEVHEMKPEYDFAGGVRGKHASRYAKSTNIVVATRFFVSMSQCR